MVTVQTASRIPIPLPVDIHSGAPADAFEIMSFFVSIALALFTGALFLATRNMAGETKRLADKTADMASRTAELATSTVSANLQSDAQHQQGLWPLLVVEAAEIASESGPPALSVNLRNIGAGPCVAGGMRVTAINFAGVKSPIGTWIPPMGAGASISRHRLSLEPANIGNQADVTSLVFAVEYTTIFGSFGRTQWSLTRHKNGGMMLGKLLPVEHPSIITTAAPITNA